MASDRAFVRSLARAFAQEAREVAEPQVRLHSRTLANALRVRSSASGSVLLIPHYWAVYLHDGRGPVRAKPGSFLIWYRNPAEDPRFRGRQTPQRARQVRRLTRSEFRRAVALFESGSGRVVITRGPVRGTSATRFFENNGGMREFADDRAPDTGEAMFRRHVFERLRRELGLRTVPFVTAGRPVVLPLEVRTLRIGLR